MAESILVYFVTEGPVWGSDIHDNDVWQVKAQVSHDQGKTVVPMIITFGSEEQAIGFKRDINYNMEPTVVGEEE